MLSTMVIKKRKLKIGIFGPYPPPYGGVSVHIQRLKYLLEKNNVQSTVYDVTQFFDKKGKSNDSSVKKWPLIIFFRNGVVHVHVSGLNIVKIFLISNILRITNNKIIITFHSLRNDIENRSWLHKKIMSLGLTRISNFIVVNQEIKEKLISVGIKSGKIIILPAFLPPNITKEDIEVIPSVIWDFIHNHHPIICANAFRIEFFNNQDLYGIDMCIDLCKNIKKKYPKIGFIFCLPAIGDDNYFIKMKNMISENCIDDNFFFVTNPYHFYPILMKSDLFVRPTNTDGDAISIRESLFFKIPVLASDVIPRPKGTRLFSNRNLYEFSLKVENILENYGRYKKELDDLKQDDNFNEIIKIYKKLS